MRVKMLKDRAVPTGPTQQMLPRVYRHAARGYAVTAKKGNVVSVSEATGKKWIDAGLAEATDAPETREKLG